MQIGRVAGQAVATVKHPSMHGWRLLLVQPLAGDGTDDGEPVLAIDNLGAGTTHRVIVTNDGASVQQLLGRNTPVRWMVLGVCD